MTPDEIQYFNRFLNYGYTDKTGKMIAWIHPVISMRLFNNRTAISGKSTHNIQPAATIDLNLPEYHYGDSVIGMISDHLTKHLKNEIFSVILHGSIATGEVISYSDVDGLIILKDHVFQNRELLFKTALHLNATFRLMLAFDPLQHHGWHILPESALSDWPAWFLPPVILKHACVLPGFNGNFSVRYTESGQYDKRPLIKIAERINRVLSVEGFPTGCFRLKSLLSEFMLLPSLFIQVKTGKEIFKKDSFGEAGMYFESGDWKVMDDVSTIRLHWPSFREDQLFKPAGYMTPLVRMRQKSDMFHLPAQISHMLSRDLKERMIKFTNLIIEKAQ